MSFFLYALVSSSVNGVVVAGPILHVVVVRTTYEKAWTYGAGLDTW